MQKERRRTEKSRKSEFLILEYFSWDSMTIWMNELGMDEYMMDIWIGVWWDNLTVCKMYVIYSLLIEYYHEQKLSRQSKTMVSKSLQQHQKAAKIAHLQRLLIGI